MKKGAVWTEGNDNSNTLASKYASSLIVDYKHNKKNEEAAIKD